MKSLLSGSTAFAGAALLSGFLIFTAKTSPAETLLSQAQQSKSQTAQTSTTPPLESVQKATLESAEVSSVSDRPVAVTGKVVEESKEAAEAGLPVPEPLTYVATAYSLRGRTASGRYVTQGIIAADPRVLPLGSRVRLEAGRWSGEYLVADTGGRIKGRRIDIWAPSGHEAMRFGKRKVKLTILSYGGKRKAAVKKPVQI
jgi:3D (Asp-Asp-Asp) domain-containing protein